MLAFILLAAQLRVASVGDSPRHDVALRDSTRDQGRARSAQASFERVRRSLLPLGSSGEGRCEVHLGRYCWWYDDSQVVFPPEDGTITRRRDELLAELDALGEPFHPYRSIVAWYCWHAARLTTEQTPQPPAG